MRSKLFLTWLGLYMMVVETSASTPEEDRDVLFAENGPNPPLKPNQTLQILKRLSETYSQKSCGLIGWWLGGDCMKNKNEMDTLIDVSYATEEKCSQSYLNHIDSLLKKYRRSKVNLVPYLNYCKEHLITQCINQFFIDLASRGDFLHDFIDSDSEYSDSESSDSDDDDEEQEGRNLRKHEEEEYLAREKAFKRTKQLELDENFINRYNNVFFKGAGASKAKELLPILQSLDEEVAYTSDTSTFRSIDKRIYDLVDLPENIALSSTCDRQNFKKFDSLAEEYKTGYSSVIREYVLYWRNEFWKMCKKCFLEKLASSSEYPIDELFPLVDKVLAADQPNNKAHLDVSLKAVEIGLTEYMKQSPNKKSDKKRIKPTPSREIILEACKSLQFKLDDVYEIDKIVKDHPEYEPELDATSRKWLSAVVVCRILDQSPILLSQEQNLASEQIEAKKKFGLQFNINLRKGRKKV